ncbi:MAG: hypothetical protein R3F14_38380 [Polyangiaceae bacterium]
MTTNPRVLHAASVFVENELLQLGAEHRPNGREVAAIGWLFRERPAEAHQKATSLAVSAVLGVERSMQAWLVAMHAAVQPNTEFVRRQKLWLSLSRGGLHVPGGRRTTEYEILANAGARWCGGLALEDEAEAIAEAARIVDAEAGSSIVMIERASESGLSSLLQHGWSIAPFGPPVETLAWVMGVNGLIFWPLGAFDDAESGGALLGAPDRLKVLFDSLNAT